MTIQDTRRQRLLQLIEERFKGVKRQLAKALDDEPQNVYRLFSEGKGRRGIGDELARSIEVRLGLPRYWLDGEVQNTPELSPRSWGIVRKLQDLERGGRVSPRLYDALEAMLDAAGQSVS